MPLTKSQVLFTSTLKLFSVKLQVIKTVILANKESRTYPLHYWFGSLWTTSWTTSCSPSPTPAAGASKTPEIDVQKAGDVVHRLAEEVAVIVHVLHRPLDFLKD